MDQKKRLLWAVGSLLVVGFTITSLGSFFISRASLRAQITENQLPLTSDNIYSEIQRDLLSPVLISSLMATDTFLRDWVVRGERDVSQITRYLKEIQVRYRTVTSFFVSERTRVYYHADGILKKVSAEEPRDAWYFRVREMAGDFEINVDPDLANRDAMTIFINYRVYDDRGNFIGAAGVGLTVGAVIELIERYQERYGREIYFVDRRGAVTLHGSTFRARGASLFEMGGVAAIADEILANRRNLFVVRHGGRTVHLNTRFIPELGWHLIVEQREEETTRHIVRALVASLAVSLLITIAAVLLVHLSIRGYQRRLEKMATEDRLTGAYNRHAFDIVYRQALREAQRNKTLFSVVLFDIDDFKLLNDRHGHLAGDAVLRHIVRVVQRSTRDSDTLFRWGGEEFLILLRECDQKNALGTAEKIRSAVERSPTLYRDRSIPVTVSAGVTEYHPADDEDALLGRVDRALFRAKRHGKNRSEGESPQSGG